MTRAAALPFAVHALPAIAALVLGWALAGNAAAAASPRWFDGERPSAAALQAVALLADAAAEGLEPRDYAAAPLQQALAAAAAGAAPDAAAIEQLEQGLSLAFERYLSDLRRGRVEPRRVRSDYDPPPPFDAAAALQAALRSGQLAAAVQAAQPRLPLYRALRTLLAHYRGLVGHPAWREPLPPLPGGAAGKLAPGQPWAGTGLLAARLAALGDLAPDAAVPGAFDGALVDALRAFQRRHGLEPDGVIGRATYAQLQVAPARRVRQIELTLERLRWTPLELGPRMIVDNLPEFVLRAYDVRDGQVSVQREMRVVIGRAFDTRTPVFVEPMRAIEFSPYWNVPPSIARSETVPKLRRDPARWARAARSRSSPATAARAPTRSCARRAAAASRRTACTCRAARSTCGCPGLRWPSCARRRSRCAPAASATTQRAASCTSTPGACAAGDAAPRAADTVVDRRAGAPQRAAAARRRLDQNRSGSRSPRAAEAACT